MSDSDAGDPRDLTPEEQQVLQEVAAAVMALPDGVTIGADAWCLPDDVCRELVDALGDALASTGFEEDFEPNARGLILESLLDKMNPDMDPEW